MRHSNLFRPAFGFIVWMLVCATICFMSSCIDDTFDKYRQGTSGLLTFDVQVPGNWTDGTSSRATTDISIKSMSQSGNEKPLYLVTEISEATVDTVVSDAVTRGAPVTSTSDFYKAFGLSAICYTGAWAENENNWTTNFAHNLKVINSGTAWNAEDKLNWSGSGNIKFFAYSPYPDTDELKNIISHSGTSYKGTPTITYTVPKEVTKQPDFMTAVADCHDNGQGGTVTLKFTHALTAITIKAGDDMLAGTITGISISGVYGTGTYKIGSDTWNTTGSPTTFSIEDMNVSLPEDKDENDKNIDTKPGSDIISGENTFMMIPQTLGEGAKLEVQFTDNLTQTVRTLTANLKGSTWQKGKKVTYSISSTGIKIEPAVKLKIDHHNIWMNGKEPENAEQKNAYLPVSGYLHDVQLAAYATVAQADCETKTVAVSSVEIEYSTDDGKTWMATKGNEYGWLPDNEGAASTLADNPTALVPGSILLPAQDAFNELRDKAVKTGNFKTNELKGSKNEYYDLVENNPIQRESANCYIINHPGYYKFPTWYGNTFQGINKEGAYTYKSPVTATDILILEKFVGHDDKPINGTEGIPGIKNAMLVWQDSPDLVTDIKYDDSGWVYFYAPQSAFNQGNAVIAVRNAEDEILWSWHIWATYCDLNNPQISKAKNEYDRPFQFLRNNLGYCDSHKESPERRIRVRFKVTMPDGDVKEVTSVTVNDIPLPEDGKGIFTFTQPKIVESIAGDNPYFQWGRKDPMLPGVYNAEIVAQAPIGGLFGDYDKVDYSEELDMENKVFYSTINYKFTSAESGRSIGESIKEPHHFFMHKRPGINSVDDGEKDPGGTENYLRRHWHDGRNLPNRPTSYDKKAIMNFWNSQLNVSGPNGSALSPNNKYVIKTIYDPSPAGYKIPPPAAFSKFAKSLGDKIPKEDLTGYDPVLANNIVIGWKIEEQDNGDSFFFPATGLRDMGIHHREVEHGTWPAHSKLTFIASSGFQGTNDIKASSSCLLFSIDNRSVAIKNERPVCIIYGTNNAYGFTLRPIRDGQQ